MADLEHRLDELSRITKESVDRLNARIDQLLDLAKEVALLDAKTDSHSLELERAEASLVNLKKELLKEISKIDSTYKELIDEKKESLIRLHGRVDTTEKANKEIAENVGDIDKKIESKVSFFKGMSLVIGCLVVVLQAAGLFIYADTDKRIQTLTTISETHAAKFHENDRQMDQILNNLNKDRK